MQSQDVSGLDSPQSAALTKSEKHLSASGDEHEVPAAVFLAVPRMQADGEVSEFKVWENLIAEQ